jgi:hypothetical protein
MKAAFRLKADYLTEKTDEIVKLVTSDEFLDRVNKVLQSPREEQVVLASETLTPEALHEAGVKLPEKIRISSRYFEEGANEATFLGEFPGLPEPRVPQIPDLPPVPRAGPRIPGIDPANPFPPRGPRIPRLPGDPLPPIGGDASGDDPLPGGLLPDDAARSLCICVGAGGCVGVGGDI